MRARRAWALLVMALAVAAAALPGIARAQVGSDRYASLVMDAATGNVMSAVNPDEPRYPASLTKMMTLYMAFEALRDRRVSLDELVPVSMHAAMMVPSKLGLVPGTRLTVAEAIDALVTKSANDAAAALGEMLGGSEDRFAQMMTLRARALGMEHTVFRNASGLPDPEQVTTARDLALLARHLIRDFPDEYRYFSIPSFVFHGRLIPNHDHMLQTYPGADGIKTGYTEASGCNLVTSAARGDVRLIGVVMGAAHSAERDEQMAVLLDAGFGQMGVPVLPRSEPQRLAAAAIARSAESTLAASPAPTLVVARRLHTPLRHGAHPMLVHVPHALPARSVSIRPRPVAGKLLHPPAIRRHAEMRDGRLITG
jgi:D-alanyl-D-alanine carboxypeptidase